MEEWWREERGEKGLCWEKIKEGIQGMLKKGQGADRGGKRKGGWWDEECRKCKKRLREDLRKWKKWRGGRYRECRREYEELCERKRKEKNERWTEWQGRRKRRGRFGRQ